MADLLEAELYAIFGASVFVVLLTIALWQIEKRREGHPFWHRGKSEAELEAIIRVQILHGIPPGTDWETTQKLLGTTEYPVRPEKALVLGRAEKEKDEKVKGKEKNKVKEAIGKGEAFLEATSGAEEEEKK